MDIPFSGNANSVTFALPYPENSQFVAVVSDATGFGSGGTSVAAQVTASNNATCFDTTKSVSPLFVFSIVPLYQIVQCVDTRIWWDPATVQGTPNFLGVIPGGQSFAIPEGQITNVTEEGTGFTWKPAVRGGTTLILVGGDSRGNGTAGSSLNVVSTGINNDASCLSDSSPSSTPGSPAGGSYPTSTNGGGVGWSSTTNSGGGSTNVGAIVGGVIGGLALIIIALILLWFFRKRGRTQHRYKERPVDLINAGEDDDDDDDDPRASHGGVGGASVRRNELPQYYQPEPFMVPDPTLDGRSSLHGGTQTGTTTDDLEGRRPLSGATSSFYTRATTPDTASGFGFGAGAGSSSHAGERRKGGAPRPMRAVNIIQHDDAGPSLPLEDGKEEEPETIELPPAYTAVGRSRAGGGEENGGGGAPPPATAAA
ncbi:hypothetical protein BDN70DRAFT_805702 [Pholiota conissans]|uniref:Uncharacterized protein n=1 Tax=Pholiota conissans TaxID=109636 RepID=A0A9P5Z3V5_9AGAR|nr:hypothetical protein BDN70DRAFT_805702 [Pholiota conissans]